MLEEGFVRTNGNWKRPDSLTQAELEKRRQDRLPQADIPQISFDRTLGTLFRPPSPGPVSAFAYRASSDFDLRGAEP